MIRVFQEATGVQLTDSFPVKTRPEALTLHPISGRVPFRAKRLAAGNCLPNHGDRANSVGKPEGRVRTRNGATGCAFPATDRRGNR